MQTIHATAMCFGALGILLRGVPGSGKSSLALQLIEERGSGVWGDSDIAKLVADDQVALALHDGKLIASPPVSLAGLLEVRGLGVIQCPHAAQTEVRLVVDLTPASAIERLPAPGDMYVDILGLSLPRVAVDATHPSAASRVRLAAVAVSKGLIFT